MNDVLCPTGSYKKAGKCIAILECPVGTTLVEGQGCVKQVIAQRKLSKTNASQELSRSPTSSEKWKSPISDIYHATPKWSFITLSLGIATHILNYNVDSSNLNALKSTFITAVAAYGASAAGLSYGLFKEFKTNPQTKIRRSLTKKLKYLNKALKGFTYNLSFSRLIQ